MSYCIKCASPMREGIPEMDDKLRLICDACGHIHYENPKLIVGTLPTKGNQILLCRRNIEPKYDYWTLPAGFLEIGETMEQGALRETHEEAGADIEMGELFLTYSIPHFGHMYILYKAEVLSDRFDFGFETKEVRLFTPEEIPWEQIAFHSITYALEKHLDTTATAPHSGYFKKEA